MFDPEDLRPSTSRLPKPVSRDEHGVRSVACPFCHAAVGEPCHSTERGSRVHVHRDHQARFDAYEQAKVAAAVRAQELKDSGR